MSDRLQEATVRVLRGGVIVDGNGGPATPGDVVLDGSRILSVGGLWPRESDPVIDVRGLVVAPGFVDIHTHSDVSLLSDPGAVSALEQGITTQQIGLCGFSAAPLCRRRPGEEIDDPIFGYRDVPIEWSSVREYRDLLSASHPATNVVMLVGHNTVRRETVGTADRPPTEPELAAMERAVAEALDAGARGFSTGLTYAPGTFAPRVEIEALVRLTARRGGSYHTHMRYRSHGQPGAVMASLDEAVETARSAAASINISHLYPHPSDRPDEAERLLAVVDHARSSGLEVTFDVTVFTRGGGAFAQQLPAWAKAGGGAELARRLSEPATRRRLHEEMTASSVPAWKRDWGDRLVVKTGSPRLADVVGRDLRSLAEQRRQHPLDVAFDLLREDPQVWMATTSKRQQDLDKMLSHPIAIPVTDGLSAHPEKHRPLGLMPKTFGTFPHWLGRYVRDHQITSLEVGVRRATGMAAERINLTDRGRLESGLAADVVAFDPTHIANRATDTSPAERPVGIRHVFVNGVHAVRDGRVTGARAGTVL